MNPEFSSKQLVRLTPEAVKVIDQYRRSVKRETGKTPSVNGAINSLVVNATHIEHDTCWKQAFAVIDQCEIVTIAQREEMLKRLDRAMNSKADQKRQSQEYFGAESAQKEAQA